MISSKLRKYGSAPAYKFVYIPPKMIMRPKIVPFEEWKGSKLIIDFR